MQIIPKRGVSVRLFLLYVNQL